MAIAACYAGLLAPAPAVAYAAYAAPAPAVAYAAPAAYAAAPVAYAAAPAAVREDSVVAGPSGTIVSSKYGAGAVYYG